MFNKDLRIAKGGITYEEIAKQAHLNKQTVYKWFNRELDEVKKGILLNAINEIKNK